MPPPKCCVYVLRSRADTSRYYTGVTNNWRARLEAHNAGQCSHTCDGKPWDVDIVIQFTDERRAVAFERYLKSGSGCAFARRHLRRVVVAAAFRPAAGQAASTGRAAHERPQRKVWVSTLTRRRAWHSAGQDRLDSIEQVV